MEQGEDSDNKHFCLERERLTDFFVISSGQMVGELPTLGVQDFP